MKKFAALVAFTLVSTFLGGAVASASQSVDSMKPVPRVAPLFFGCSPSIQYSPIHHCYYAFNRQPSPVEQDEANDAPETVVSAVTIDGDELDDIITTPGESAASKKAVARVDRQITVIAEDYEACEGECLLNLQVHMPEWSGGWPFSLQLRADKGDEVACELTKTEDTIPSATKLLAPRAAELAVECIGDALVEQLGDDAVGFVTVIADEQWPPASLRSTRSSAMNDQVWDAMRIEILVQDVDPLVAKKKDRSPAWEDPCKSYDCRQGYCDPYCP